MKKSQAHRALLLAAGAAALFGSVDVTFAQFTSISTFIATNPPGGPYSWADATNWSTGTVSTATTLVRVANLGATTVSAIPDNAVAYGLDLDIDTGSTLFQQNGTTPLILKSLDSVYDPANNRSPAVNTVVGATGTISFRAPLQLGDGSVPSGTMFVNHNGPGNTIQVSFDKVTQVPGTTMGMTFTGPGLTALRAATNSGNYLTNRWDITGTITVARNSDNTNARIIIFNSILPYGPGLPNLKLDGRLIHQHNGNSLILNAIDSNLDTAQIARTAGTDVVVGANGANGSWAGRLESTATSLYKIGAGTQVLSNGTSAYARTTFIEGVVSVNSIANQGVNSTLGNGSLVFDGGGLHYTGAGHSTDRLVQVGFRGGTIEASGTGSLSLLGTIDSTDLAHAWGDNTNAGPSQIVTNMYGINGLQSLAAAGSLQITSSGVGLTGANGTSPVSINETTREMELASGATNGTPGNGFGQPRIVFTATSGVARTLTLAGTNTDNNTIGGNLANSGNGGTLHVTKSGSGKWVLSGTNTYTGSTIVDGGVLQLNVNAHGPVLAGGATTSFADIKGSSLIFDYTGGASVGTTVLGILDAGYDQPTKFSDGPIRSSTATALIGLGWEDDTTAQQVTVKRTYFGDADLNGQVDVNDLGTLATNWQTPRTWAGGDFDYDRSVGVNDLGMLATNWQAGVGNPLGPDFATAAAALGLPAAAVPEPTALMSVGVAAALLRRSRRPRRPRR
jgi:fibronectin-binding autotransporter adhesin